jgi:hypothetical protein
LPLEFTGSRPCVAPKALITHLHAAELGRSATGRFVVSLKGQKLSRSHRPTRAM